MSKTSINGQRFLTSCMLCHLVVSRLFSSRRSVLPILYLISYSTLISLPHRSTVIVLNAKENVLLKCSVAVRLQSWLQQPSPHVDSISPTSPTSSITIFPATLTTMSIVSVVPVVPETQVCLPLSSTVEIAISLAISSIFSKKPTRKSQASLKPLPAKVVSVEVVVVEDIPAVVVVAEPLETEITERHPVSVAAVVVVGAASEVDTATDTVEVDLVEEATVPVAVVAIVISAVHPG